MPGIDVLAPLRLETRFLPPDAAHATWRLRLRVYPDEFSMRRTPPPPTPEEIARLDEALAGAHRDPPVDDAAAFRVFAGAVGAPRALWLWRTVPRVVVNGRTSADATIAAPPPAPPVPDKPFGLPAQLHVWLVRTNGPALLATTLAPDAAAIAGDLDFARFAEAATLPGGALPRVWWTSFARAVAVGLGAEIDLGAAVPDLEAIVVAGTGEDEVRDLVDAHASSSRLAVLAPGTPTNTVNGEATTELGRDPDAWWPLASADPAQQPATDAVVRALTGRGPSTAPLLGGDLDHEGAQFLLVGALWDVLWGRSLRDVVGAGDATGALAMWARGHLAAEGPLPAVRVGTQPYGLLPVTSLRRWVSAPGDPACEPALRDWVMAWRDLAADAAEAAGTVRNATTEQLVALLGERAPSRAWGVRPVAALAIARALRAMAGMPATGPTRWDEATSSALAGTSQPQRALAPVGGLYPLQGEALDRRERVEVLEALLKRSPAELLEHQEPLGLFGHLLREAMLLARARIGLAVAQLAGGVVDADASLPLFTDPHELVPLIGNGDDGAVQTLAATGVPGAADVVDRFELVRKLAHEAIRRWEREPDRVFGTLLAVLDTACFRVDPWVTGLAHRRLRSLSAQRVPFRLGAYAWVDRPAPASVTAGALPPGPTPAGLLHAPSYAQALTAALLRDARVRHPGDARWQLEIDSTRVRAALRLAERVRLGVHAYEALGLEVERLVGDWNAVRELRRTFPLRDAHEGRRCCDGARVLRAVFAGSEPLPAGMPPTLADTLRPLNDALDTYADLLVADGLHALVSGRVDLANAAMEAAAGLGAPPELRAMRTPRRASTVRVSAWALLPAGDDEGATPAAIVDPAFVQLLDDELGAPEAWTWRVRTGDDDATVSLADRVRHGVELLDAPAAAIVALVRAGFPDDAVVTSTGGDERLASARALAELLGGSDEASSVPAVDGGSGDSLRDAALQEAMRADLQSRVARLRTGLADAIAAIDAVAVGDEDEARSTLAALAAWNAGGVSLEAVRRELAARLTASLAPVDGIAPLRAALRRLAGVARLPVLPVVARALLPALPRAPIGAEGRPVLDVSWLEIVAAVRPRLAVLEARQLDARRAPWPAALHAKQNDPWSREGPVVVAYGPAVATEDDVVALAALDAWVDSIPSAEHTTAAAFGFNGPKSRPPQAVLLAVPPDVDHRLTPNELLDVVLETRLLVRARASRPGDVARVATPSALVTHAPRLSFVDAWWPA